MKEKHLWLVAHPTKLTKDPKQGTYPVPTLYDISGSAHFRNKADMGLSVWRDVMNEHSPTEVHVQKVRFRECGRIGKCELYFDVVSGRFTETVPQYERYMRRVDHQEREAEQRM
jgi:twinkle protein